MPKFKKHDLVKLIRGWRVCYICDVSSRFKAKAKTGMTGQIITSSVGSRLDIQFNKNVDGHDCNGNAKNGHGQVICERHLKMIKIIKKTSKNSNAFKIINYLKKGYLVVIEHNLSAFKSNYAIICFIRPTANLREAKTIVSSYHESKIKDCFFSLGESSYSKDTLDSHVKIHDLIHWSELYNNKYIKIK